MKFLSTRFSILNFLLYQTLYIIYISTLCRTDAVIIYNICYTYLPIKAQQLNIIFGFSVSLKMFSGIKLQAAL